MLQFLVKMTKQTGNRLKFDRRRLKAHREVNICYAECQCTPNIDRSKNEAISRKALIEKDQMNEIEEEVRIVK